jgi:hypothetical protein
MKLPLALLAAFLLTTAAHAAGKIAAKPKPCPKGQAATTSKITGDQHCFVPQAFMVTPAKGGKVTPPVLKTN